MRPTATRLVLVANNPRASLAGILPTDAIVQFNHCEHFARLAAHPGPRIFACMVQAQGPVSGWHDATPHHDYSNGLTVIIGRSPCVEMALERLGWPYRNIGPSVPHYGRKIPSAGFAVLTRLVRLRVPVALVGWTHKGWPGHDYEHERRWCDARGIERI